MKEFYDKCGEILGVEHVGDPFPYTKRTRWNNRVPGQGRFPGVGVIRVYGSGAIHVALRRPRIITKTFKSEEAVFEFLRQLNS